MSYFSGKTVITRWLPVIVGGTLLVFSAAAFLIGLKAEEHFTTAIARIDANNGINLELTEYQRGFFSSRAVTRLHPDPAGQRRADPANEKGEREIVHRIQHGPLPLAGPSNRRSPGIRPLLAEVNSRLIDPTEPGEQALLRAHTVITFGGRGETSFDMTGGTGRLGPEQAHLAFEWSDLEGKLTYPLNLEQVEGKLSGPGLTLAYRPPAGKPEELLELTGLKLQFDYRQHADGQGGTTLEANQQLTVTGIRTATDQHGPLSLELNWRNLDRQAAGQMFHLAPWWRQLLLGPGDPAGPEIPPPAAQSLVETLSVLLAKSPALEIDPIRLETAHGEAAGRLHLAYLNHDDSRPFHPIMLLSGLQLEAEASSPEPLLVSLARDYRKWRGDNEQAEQEGQKPLAGLHRRGYLSMDEDGRKVSFSLKYQNGELTINDRPAPFQSLRHLLP